MNKALLILTTANQLEFTKKAINSLLDCEEENIDLLVVDDASNDGTVEYCRDNNIPIHIKKKSRGVTHSWNVGYRYFKEGNYDYAIFANNDILIPKGSLPNFLSVLQEKAIVGALTTEKGVPFDPEQALKNNYQVDQLDFDVNLPDNFQKTQDFINANNTGISFKPVASVNGFFFGVNQSVIDYELDEATLFSPSLINVGNEYELCERIGEEKVICLNAFIFHYKGISFLDHHIEPDYDYGRQLTWRQAQQLKKSKILRNIYKLRSKINSRFPTHEIAKPRAKSFQKNLLKNLSQVALYQYSGHFLLFLASIITSRLLTPAEYGFVALITVFSAFIILFLDAGLTASIIRNKPDRNFQTALQFLGIVIGLLLGLLMIGLSVPISLFYSNDSLIIPCMFLGLIIFSRSLQIVPSAILSKHLKFKIKAKISLIQTVSVISMTIIFALAGFSFWAIIIPQLLSPILVNALYRRVVRIPFKIPSREQLNQTLRKTKKLIGNISTFSFFNYWARNSDNLAVGKFYGESSLGIYSRAYSLLEFPMLMLSGIISHVQLPSFQKLIDQGKDVKTEYEIILKAISILILPFTLIFLLFPYKICITLWGNNWSEVGDFLPVFGVLLMLQSMISTTGSMFIVFKKEKMFAMVGSINALIMIGAIIIGSQLSLMSIAYFYAYAYVLICVPVLLYWGFIKSFGFKIRQMLSTFGLVWLYSLLLLFNITIFKSEPLLYVLIALIVITNLIQGAYMIRKIKIPPWKVFTGKSMIKK